MSRVHYRLNLFAGAAIVAFFATPASAQNTAAGTTINNQASVSYSVGGSPPSYDKQFVRDYLETLDWDKTPPAPHLPPDVIARTSAKYREALERLTGRKLA